MRKYFFRRILIMLPTMFIISVVAFWLSRIAPGDPAECGNAIAELSEVNPELFMKEYKKVTADRGLDLPPFYISINSLAHPDTLQRILPKSAQEVNLSLIQKFGNWEKIDAWRKELFQLDKKIASFRDQVNPDVYTDLAYNFKLLKVTDDHEKVKSLFREMEAMELPQSMAVLIEKNQTLFQQLDQTSTRWKLWIPTVNWNGAKNQYHQWMAGMLSGDFGVSCRNGQSAAKIVGASLKWTLMMTIPAILLTFLIAIPLGIYSGVNEGSRVDRWSSIISFVLYAMPAFWVATILLVFFTTPEYGKWLDWFPSIGLGRLPATAPFWSRFFETASHLILPIICLTYGSIAFLSRQMRTGVREVMQKQYILTARAKGLPEREVIKNHVLKNAFFPIITILGGLLPAAIGGSVVIEVIFNIPGMGRTTLDSIFARDWPVVYAIFFLSAAMTIIGIFISDVLYALADPRVKFKSSSES